MKILFAITTSDYGGTETYLRQLAEGLAARGSATPVVCSLRPTGRVGRRMAEAEGVEVFSLGMARGTRPLEAARAVRALGRQIDERSIDGVVGLLYRANVLAALAARFSRRRPPSICGQRSLNPAGQRAMVKAVQLTRGLHRHTIAVSPAVKEEILATERYPENRITVVRNGVDLARWYPLDRSAERQRWDLPPGALVIGAAGRLMPVKGFYHLIRAVSAVRKRRPDLPLRLLIAGDGAEKERLATLIQAEKASRTVRLVGRLDPAGLQSLYSACDVYALTSRAEGSPNAMLEAMACGCAPIATRVGGVPDILEEGASGWMLPPEDPEALADALERASAHRAEIRDLAEGAQRRIAEAFSLAGMIDHHERLFAQVFDAG
ncbi:MAG: glycosyltransferase [Acidobacteriota bacterium]